MNSSQAFASAFSRDIGGDVSSESGSPNTWIVNYQDDLFGESSINELLTEGQPVSSEEAGLIYDELNEQLKAYYKSENQRRYQEFLKQKYQEEIQEVISIHPEYIPLTYYDGNSCLLLDKNNNTKVLFQSIRNYNTREGTPYVIAINRQLSYLGIAPPLYLSGKLRCIGYLIFEYLPISLQEAIKRGLISELEAQSMIEKFINIIHSLQIYPEVSWENFVYDQGNIYMTNFDKAKLEPCEKKLELRF